MNTRWLNFFERVLWTLVQAATAEGVLAVWESLQGPLPADEHASLVVTLTTFLAIIKNVAAQAFGSPTGATLPSGIRPVPAETTVTVNQVQDAVQAAVTSALSQLIAPTVAGALENAGTPVVTDSAAGPGQIPATQPPQPTAAPAETTNYIGAPGSYPGGSN